MKRVLRIEDIQDGVFLHPSRVLTALAPEAADLNWTVLDLGETVARDDADDRLDVLALEAEVSRSATGLHMTFEELVRLAALFAQVIDGLFIGCTNMDRFPSRSDSDAVILERADIAVAAFDSSFWLISGPDTVTERLDAAFDRVTHEDPAEVKLSAWDR